jgi:hypothetical protein
MSEQGAMFDIEAAKERERQSQLKALRNSDGYKNAREAEKKDILKFFKQNNYYGVFKDVVNNDDLYLNVCKKRMKGSCHSISLFLLNIVQKVRDHH